MFFFLAEGKRGITVGRTLKSVATCMFSAPLKSCSGSESLEATIAPKMPVLRNEILPVVWRFSELQNTAASTAVVAETTSDSSLRELVQVLLS